VLLTLAKTTGSNNYTRAITLQLLVLCYQAQERTCAWRMFENNLSCFNEETGELAFSLLARSVLGDSMKSKFDHLNDLYTLLHTYLTTTNDIKADQDRDGPARNWRKVLKRDSEEVTGTTAWLKGFLRKLKHNDLRVYNGEVACYKSSSLAAANLVARGKRAPMYSDDIQDARLEHVIGRCATLLRSSELAHDMSDVWPEFAHQPPVLVVFAAPAHEDDLDERDDDSDYEQPAPVGAVPHHLRNQLVDSCDGDSVDDEVVAPVAPDVAVAGAREKDARGEQVTWNEWQHGNGVSSRNILSESRSSRRGGAKRDFSHMGMVHADEIR
jgi:hypothetical protein